MRPLPSSMGIAVSVCVVAVYHGMVGRDDPRSVPRASDHVEERQPLTSSVTDAVLDARNRTTVDPWMARIVSQSRRLASVVGNRLAGPLERRLEMANLMQAQQRSDLARKLGLRH